MGRWDAGLDEPSAWLNCFHSLGEAHLETGSSWSVYIGILGSSTSLARISSPYVWLQVSKGELGALLGAFNIRGCITTASAPHGHGAGTSNATRCTGQQLLCQGQQMNAVKQGAMLPPKTDVVLDGSAGFCATPSHCR